MEDDRDLTEFTVRLRSALLRLDAEVGDDQHERGWLQRIAHEFHVSHTAVRKWLYGESMPDMKRLASIARRCRVNFNWLANGEGDMEIIALSPEEKALVLCYRTADFRGKRLLEAVAEAQTSYS